MSRLDELHDEWLEKHRDADELEFNIHSHQCTRAIYYSPKYKADEPIREFFREVQKLEQENQ